MFSSNLGLFYYNSLGFLVTDSHSEPSRSDHLKFQPSGFVVSPAVTSNTFRAGSFGMLGIQFDFLGLGVGDMGLSSLDARVCLAGGCNRCSFFN